MYTVVSISWCLAVKYQSYQDRCSELLVLVHKSELGGLEIGGKRNSLDIEIIQFWGWFLSRNQVGGKLGIGEAAP